MENNSIPIFQENIYNIISNNKIVNNITNSEEKYYKNIILDTIVNNQNAEKNNIINEQNQIVQKNNFNEIIEKKNKQKIINNQIKNIKIDNLASEHINIEIDKSQLEKKTNDTLNIDNKSLDFKKSSENTIHIDLEQNEREINMSINNNMPNISDITNLDNYIKGKDININNVLNNEKKIEKNKEKIIKKIKKHSRPVYKIPPSKKRSISQGKSLSFIHKYYDENFILEEDSEDNNSSDSENKINKNIVKNVSKKIFKEVKISKIEKANNIQIKNGSAKVINNKQFEINNFNFSIQKLN